MLFNSLWPITRCLYDSIQSNYRRESYQVRKTPLLIDRTSSTFANQFVEFYGCGLMCPKKKSDHIQTIRFEFQETERQALEMFIASNAAKNVGDGLGSIISAFTRASLPGTILWGSVMAFLAIELESLSPGALFPGTIGQLGANEEVTPFYPKQDGETAKEYRNRTTMSSRLKYGLWTQPRETLKEDYEKLMDLI